MSGHMHSELSWVEWSPHICMHSKWRKQRFEDGRIAFISLTMAHIISSRSHRPLASWESEAVEKFFGCSSVFYPYSTSRLMSNLCGSSACSYFWWRCGTGSFTCCPSSWSCSSHGTTSRSALAMSAMTWWVQGQSVTLIAPPNHHKQTHSHTH